MILIGIFRYFPFGGLQSDTLRLIHELLARHQDVLCLTTSWQGEQPDSPHFSCEITAPQGLSNTARMHAFGQLFARRAETVRAQGGIAVAMNRLPNADIYFAADACMKTVLQQKFLWPLLKFLPRYRAILAQEAEVLLQPRTHFLLISSRQQVDFLREYPFLTPQRFTLLPPGINPHCVNHTLPEPQRSELRRRLGVHDETPLVISVGTNWRVKGMDRAMDILRDLPCHYAIIGNDSPEAIEKLRRQHHFPAERFTFTGPRQDIPDLLCAANLMLHPARNEGAGSVLLEALACQLPVVCTDVCGFSPFVLSLDERLVIPEPFSLEKARDAVRHALDAQHALRQHLARTVDGHDFTKRTSAFADIILQHQHA